ncbi:MAG: nuclear transport factor 2 family protein [Tepidiformaceae bacterium]
MDIEQFNADWLQAWSDKDTAKLLTMYHPEVIYKDAQVPAGLVGRDALGAYLNGLFAATPPMTYVPHETWATKNGFCGRWICTMALPDGTSRYMRGFDLVVLRDNMIVLNEVYTHALAEKP